MDNKIKNLEFHIRSLETEIEEISMKNNELEKKVDRILSGDLSTPFEKNLVASAIQITNEIDKRYEANLRKCGLS